VGWARPAWRWCHSALANSLLSRGDLAAAERHAVRAAELCGRPSEHYGIAALAATYAGRLERAREFNTMLAGVATSATLRALRAYVAGEIENAAGHLDTAETHYVEAISVSGSARSTFIEGIATVGLVTVRAAAGRITEALAGYQELIDYWERTGGWLQQWTTLRNLAFLLRRLGDHEPALFLAAAADCAPDAPAVNDGVWDRPPPVAEPARVERIRSEAAVATRAEVLSVARQVIARHLARPPAPATSQ
jgi:tetratricopeptide (TPR) repeat protein